MNLVEVHRGLSVESVHTGMIAVVDAEGRTVFSAGDVETPVFPRSAVKLLQALPLIETGAADAFALTDAELALACSSHSGEPAHVATADAMLARLDAGEADLACSGHWSLRQPVLLQQAREHDETPGALYNNCSGKHSGFLTVCRRRGWPLEGYERPDHPLQRHLAELMTDLTGEAHTDANRAVDGCSIPTYAVPLRSLALAFSRAFWGEAVPAERRRAAERLAQAAMAEPFHTAGTDRFCTDYMRASAGAAYAKTGAEGVYCGVLPEQRLAIALKVSDGASRASEVAFAAVANAFLGRDDLRHFETAPIRTWGGEDVGTVTVVPDLHARLLAAAAGTG